MDSFIFAGTSNQPLATEISKISGIPLGEVEITRFIDSECRVYIKEQVTGRHIYVVQSLSEVADQHLVELCLVGSSLNDLGASRITAIIPWLGYSKQDKAFRKGEAVSAQLIAKFIEVAGFTDIITCELHSENILKYFSVPVRELSTKQLFTQVAQGATVISPDKGGVSRSQLFAKEINAPIVFLTKERNLQTGEVHVTGVSHSVSGKNCIIFDDIINTGATAIETSKFLVSQGAATVRFIATHAALAGNAIDELTKSHIDSLYVTDTIHIPKEKQFEKMHIISVASLLADAISSIVS